MPFRVLILGGGFTGLEAARRLAKKGAEVTVVDPSSHALFTPRLVDALAQECREPDLRVAHTTLAKTHGYTCIEGKATQITHEKKRVDIELPTEKHQSLNYDTLICAYGATTNFYQATGKEHAYPLKTWEQLLTLEAKLDTLTRTHQPVRCAIIGGGATGIEAACALNARLRRLGYTSQDRTITVFQAGPQILPGFLPKTIQRTMKLFSKTSINVRLNTPIQAIHANGLETANGEQIPTDLTIWAAGIRPNEVANDIPQEQTRSELIADYTLRIEPHLFAGGDVIHLKDSQRLIPKNAQTAMKMGALIATNVLREQQGLPLKTFRYHSLGVMLWLHETSITDILGISCQSRIFTWTRKQFYHWRWREMRG